MRAVSDGGGAGVRVRYREARTLVRRLCRLPGEDAAEFRKKVRLLRAHFEQFNRDTADLCQWMMGLRKRFGREEEPAGFGTFGDFLLEPALPGVGTKEEERDRWRLSVFDDVAGRRAVSELSGRPVPEELRKAMEEARERGPQNDAENVNARRLFARLAGLEAGQRLVLLKSAAEWVVARYKRGVENWERQRAEWEREKEEWEGAHPTLTREVRERFTAIFRGLKEGGEDGKPGVSRKNPRICGWERLKLNEDNCIHAGKYGHGPLCEKYAEFVNVRKDADTKFNDDGFFETARTLAELCAAHRLSKPSSAFQSNKMLDALYAADRKRAEERAKGKGKGARSGRDAGGNAQNAFIFRFRKNWGEYLEAMGIDESTAVQGGRLQHCPKKGRELFEKSACRHNPHTALCAAYKGALVQLPDDVLALEPLYREWRKVYLAGPRKPTFKYPSARELPMPKIFGEGFHNVDLERSVVRLRLEGAGAEWLDFGFIPWPRGYRPTRREVRITSVHVNFVGVRARAGLRFEAPHKASRFGCAQEEIDELRSRVFPRESQDEAFLEAARERLVKTLAGGTEPMRLLAVDVGEEEASASVYEGRRHIADVPLKILKINRLYERRPEKLVPDRQGRPNVVATQKDDPRGVTLLHVGRHLQRLSEGAVSIAEHRKKDGEEAPKPLAHDQRSLKRHLAWMIRDWARVNAAQIVATAEEHKCDVIVFESQRGRKAPGYDKIGDERTKRSIAMFAFGRVRGKVKEKAVERGMRMVTVPTHKSSQVCPGCGHEQMNKGLWRKNKRERKFKCQCGDPGARGKEAPADPACGCRAELNSEVAAARVLARVFWGEIRLPRKAGA